jgi:stage IV sporulation protein FB
MLGTSTTPYDLRFRFLDIPVRVHPLFWLISAVPGWRDYDIPGVLMWVGCVFVSILVHEYGHGLTAKYFRDSPSIVLWGLGGLCFTHGEQTPRQRLAVLFAGPGAGFLLCGLVMLGTSGLYGISVGEHVEVLQRLVGLTSNPLMALARFPSETLAEVYWNLVQINFLWGLVNLLPIWPLDGGQVAQVVLSVFHRRQGVRRGHIISLVTAGFLALLAAASGKRVSLAIFFGVFAFINYQALQSLHQAQSFGAYQDDDWWRR